MSDKRELPAELKAVEAELAALVPRTDEIDRERLIFLAGQEAARKSSPLRRSLLERSAWPAATATMTAVAASLLAILIMQPEPVVETRIVYRDRPVTVPEDSQPAQKDEPAVSPYQELEPAHDSTLSRALAWIDFPDRRRVGMEDSYFHDLDRMLQARAGHPAGISNESPLRQPSIDTKRAAAPVTYQSLLDSLIDVPAPNDRQPDSSATEDSFSQGVNS